MSLDRCSDPWAPEDRVLDRVVWFGLGLVLATVLYVLSCNGEPTAPEPPPAPDTLTVDTRAGWVSCPPGTDYTVEAP